MSQDETKQDAAIEAMIGQTATDDAVLDRLFGRSYSARKKIADRVLSQDRQATMEAAVSGGVTCK